MEETTLNQSHKKVFRAVRLDPEMDRAINTLIEVWRGPKGHRKTRSQFMREAAKAYYNALVEDYNARRAEHGIGPV